MKSEAAGVLYIFDSECELNAVVVQYRSILEPLKVAAKVKTTGFRLGHSQATAPGRTLGGATGWLMRE